MQDLATLYISLFLKLSPEEYISTIHKQRYYESYLGHITREKITMGMFQDTHNGKEDGL